jgi:DNA-binding response OmpR family regulator
MEVLIVDDDRVLADVLAFTVRREGFQVAQAFDGEAALQRWGRDQPDLIILDVNLPKLDGFSVCQRIREQGDTPVLLLTVRDDEEDILHGLEVGADDYITKPFSPRQLVARMRAVLRRAGKPTLPATRQVGDLTLDPDRRELQVGQTDPITLTPLESRLLDYLMTNAGHTLTSEAIIEHVWGAAGGDRDMLHQLMHRLRHQIAHAQGADQHGQPENNPASYIKTAIGLGYGLASPPSTN